MSMARNLLGKVIKSASLSLESGNLVWVDLEMTGLDVNCDHILEMSCLVTDPNLSVIATPQTVVIRQPDDVLEGMGEWCTEHHGKSGLTNECRRSNISLVQAEQSMLSYVQKYTKKGQCPLAGNTIYMDKMFLMKYMPRFVDHLHYRLVDVSTIKELAKRWYPEDYIKQPPKDGAHRTLSDIEESIKELQYYRSAIFRH